MTPSEPVSRTPIRRLAALLFWLAICFLTAALGAAASIEAGEFYQTLMRPAFAPPGWLFGPVWTMLYTLMAIAIWLVRDTPGAARDSGTLAWFTGQLALNALWSWLFFEWRLGAAAFIDILLLWGVLLVTIRVFYRQRPLAAWLMIPYLLWVSFAALLNYSVWQLNPGLL